MTVRERKFLYVAIGLTISVVLLWMLFRNIDFRELAQVLQRANYYWLIPNILLIVLTMFQRALRWRSMIAPIKIVRFSKLLAATCIGFMANNVLPLRLGEFVRAYSLAAQEKVVTKSASLATILVERLVFDLIALLLIFGGVLSVTELAVSDDMKTGVYVTIAIALLTIVFISGLALKPDQAGNMLTRYLFFAPTAIKNKIRNVVMKFSRGLEFITDARMVSSVGIQTLAIWALMGISNYFVFLAFDFNLPVSASFMLLVVVSISILVPSSPGFVGVYHAGTVWTLAAYGIGREAAVSFALVLHAAQYIPITLMGFYFLKKEHLSLKSLEEEAVEEIDEQP